MKITLADDGSIQIDASEKEGAAALDILRTLVPGWEPRRQRRTSTSDRTPAAPDPAQLTPLQRSTWDILAAHPEGCHYTVVAEYQSVPGTIAATRCNQLRLLGFATRIRAGVYAPVLKEQ